MMSSLRFLSIPRRLRDRRTAAVRLLAGLSLAAGPLLAGGTAHAGSTGSTNLLMPQGTGAESQDGDFISSDIRSTGCTGCTITPLDTIYRYYIEVPSGLSRLRVQIFDADVGANGTNEQYAQRDRSRNAGGTFGAQAKYTLFNPAGTQVATQTCGSTTTAFCVDDMWESLYDTTTTPIPNGHWELDVDMSTAVNSTTGTNDINAFGIQADTGTQGTGTELPVYYLAHNQIGQNLPSATATTPGTKTYSFYPYVTSGCSFIENDFDYDLDNGTAGQNVGSIAFTSRSGSFTKTIAATSLSQNDVWASNTVSGFTTNSDSTDYGIWSMATAISNYTNTAGLNGNYANVYLGTYASTAASTTAPANNSPTPNTIRVYFPNSVDGGAPVKPYVEQEARYVFAGGAGGPNPPVVGSTTRIQVTVQVVNPTASAITFSATNLVKTNVPGAGATYGGSPTVTQGTVTAQPAVNGTGALSWNPGTVAAGATALLTYLVNVKPTAAGQNIPVVGTVASGNGTTGTFVDETGNTTQARATLAFGPLCEISATQGVTSAAEVADLHVRAGGPGTAGVVVEWQTPAEIATAGFDLYRIDPADGSWHQVNRALVPALPGAPQGGTYRVVDAEASPAAGQVLHYELVETETNGGHRRFPLLAQVEPAAAMSGSESSGPSGLTLQTAGVERAAHTDPAWEQRLAVARATSSTPSTPSPSGIAGRSGGLQAAPPVGASPLLFKIGVRQDGIYRIDPSAIGPVFSGGPGGAGGVGTDATKKGPKNLVITNQGQPVPWTTDATGAVLFYGQASRSIYTLDNVYWLSLGPPVNMGTTPGGTPTATGNPNASFSAAAHARQETFAGTALPLDPESDYWYWGFTSAGDPTNGTQSFAIATPNVNAGGGQLTLHLQGATASQHHLQASLNGTPLGDTTWSGIAPQTAAFAAGSWNAAGPNTVTLTSVLDPGVSSSIEYLQSIDAAYEGAFTAAGDSLAFTGSGNSLVTVSGFSGSNIHVFDLTNPLQPKLVQGARIDSVPASGGNPALPPTSRVTLVPQTPTTPYLAVGPGALLTPAWIQVAGNSGLAERPGGADYLVITTKDLLPAAGALAGLRAAQGLRTAVVNVADVMDEFNQGLASPHAITSFLAYVSKHWNPVPRYVVLAGDGSFDYRNFLGFGNNLVPPLMVSTDSGLYSSDSTLADVDGDGLADFAIGRLPVASNAELAAYVQKLAAWEATAGNGWVNQALMLSDVPSPDDGVTDYAADSLAITANLQTGYVPQQIALTSDTLAAARAALFGDLAAGAGLVNYFGHAGLDRLSPLSLLTSSDATSLANGPRLPVMAALTCNVNRFDVPGFSSLGELLARQPGGGAIAIWSASGTSVHPEGKALAQDFYSVLGSPASVRLGDAMHLALSRYAASGGLGETLALYTLLGDPALLLKPVTPAPPTGGPSATVRE